MSAWRFNGFTIENLLNRFQISLPKDLDLQFMIGQNLCEKIKEFESQERINHPGSYDHIEEIKCEFITK